MRERISSLVEDHVETEVWFAIMHNVADDVRALVKEFCDYAHEQELYIAREDQLEEDSEARRDPLTY